MEPLKIDNIDKKIRITLHYTFHINHIETDSNSMEKFILKRACIIIWIIILIWKKT